MKNPFFPDVYAEGVSLIDYDALISRGIRAVIFDIDNTLAPFDVADADDETLELFRGLAEKGLKCCLLSNNNEGRVNRFNERLGLCAVADAGKPGLSGVRWALGLIGEEPAAAALVGDQLFTDMWVGNRAKLTTILVKPICERDEPFVRFKRGLERILLRFYKTGAK